MPGCLSCRAADHAGKTSEGRRIKADALDAIARDILFITGKNCLQRSAMGLRKLQRIR